MFLQFKNFASLLLLIGGISVTPAGFAQSSELTLELIDARLNMLRENGVANTDETLRPTRLREPD